MNQLSNNQQLGEGSSEKPRLCRKCCEFFGNPCNDDLCSKCFKTIKTEKVVETLNVEKPLAMAEEVINIQPASHKAEEQKSELVEAKSDSKKEQADHKRCFSCTKKVGSLGYKCKCEFTYCRTHRLPEDHECEYNFKQDAIKKLTKENPTVIASKLAKI